MQSSGVTVLTWWVQCSSRSLLKECGVQGICGSARVRPADHHDSESQESSRATSTALLSGSAPKPPALGNDSGAVRAPGTIHSVQHASGPPGPGVVENRIVRNLRSSGPSYRSSKRQLDAARASGSGIVRGTSNLLERDANASGDGAGIGGPPAMTGMPTEVEHPHVPTSEQVWLLPRFQLKQSRHSSLSCFDRRRKAEAAACSVLRILRFVTKRTGPAWVPAVFRLGLLTNQSPGSFQSHVRCLLPTEM